ncbi:MAG: FAD-dependent oxidoreductase [Blastocatellia bacterium]
MFGNNAGTVLVPKLKGVAVAIGRVVIVGAGPAGSALAYLLARRGVDVTLLERHPDFERTFRGDGLQPSGIDAFGQMGLGDRLQGLPQATVNTIELYRDGRRRARLATASLGFIARFIPQPAVLACSPRSRASTRPSISTCARRSGT